jgi:hypothetical protein
MSYRVLVLPDRKAISLPVLRKLKEFVEAGATVVGVKPTEAAGLRDSDAEVQEIAATLRLVTDKPAREVLLAVGVKLDFEVTGGDAETDLDYIHRRDGDADIYFVANRSPRAESVTTTFRVTGKAPELWDPVSGERRFAAAYSEADGRTSLPLDLAPCGSMFVVFRAGTTNGAKATKNFPNCQPVAELSGPWTVKFDPQWGGPASVEFARLDDWTKRPELGIRFYSGTAIYTQTFAVPAGIPQPAAGSPPRLWLDLGELRELAEVRLNGRALGIVWTPPFRVEVTGVLQPADNLLQVEVVNFWPNRIIGDDALPPEQRFTKTNIRKLTKDTPLVPSGLFGPVRILAAVDSR